METEDFQMTEWVIGIPKAQPRARAFAVGGRARMYNPGTAEAWKADIIRTLG